MASKLSTVVVRSFAASVEGPSATAGSHAGGTKLWKRLSFLVAVPSVLLLTLQNFYLNPPKHERPDFKPYSHLRVRSKAFPWGDGNHSLFHNKHVNALPEGYEE